MPPAGVEVLPQGPFERCVGRNSRALGVHEALGTGSESSSVCAIPTGHFIVRFGRPGYGMPCELCDPTIQPSKVYQVTRSRSQRKPSLRSETCISRDTPMLRRAHTP